ncbi:MAG: dockerin type I domain-containing protein [candidate division Zixibacteria bacterium]|nr:dockerin type I domain-containing protein [candidate division Zixibacteria bacterium]
MKKCGTLFGALLLILIPVLAMAQDPGVPDTCKVDTTTVTAQGQHFVLQVRVYNDAAIGGLSLPLKFSGSSVVCDSGSFAGTRGSSASAGVSGFTIDNLQQSIIVFAVWLSGNLAPGEGPIAKLFFTVRNDAVSETVYVDTFTASGGVEIEFSSAAGIGYKPVFQKGRIRVQLPAPVKHNPGIIVPGMQQVLCDSSGCDTLRFEVHASDVDISDILTITKYGVGSLSTVPHPTPDTGFFTWVPVPADTQNSPYTDTFIVNDGTGLADTGTVLIKVKPRQVVPPSAKNGDVNGDGNVNTNDVIFLVNFLFKDGPPPKPPAAGDINADCFTTVADIIYLINYLFRGGPAPKVWCTPGDINHDGYVDLPDVIYFINYLFKSGPAPLSMKSSDVNADCTVDIVDLIYLINFLFRGGPIPQPGCVAPFYKAVPQPLADVELFGSNEINGIIEIPVSANFNLPVAGVQILVEFDPAQFEPLDPVLTERSKTLSVFSSYKDKYQIIGLLDLQAQNSIQPGTGSIVILRFKPKLANYDLNRLKISEAILVDREANTLNTTIKPNSFSTPNLR